MAHHSNSWSVHSSDCQASTWLLWPGRACSIIPSAFQRHFTSPGSGTGVNAAGTTPGPWATVKSSCCRDPQTPLWWIFHVSQGEARLDTRPGPCWLSLQWPRSCCSFWGTASKAPIAQPGGGREDSRKAQTASWHDWLQALPREMDAFLIWVRNMALMIES